MLEKNSSTSGANELTPSKSEYFSWINNTNEGSTEKQSLINLAFFKYLKDNYGMRLDIYAWDAGNLDGAGNSYEFPEGEKLKKQYPNGYAPVADAVTEIGTKLGVWGGADGYGDTEKEAETRRQMLVKLCRDYHFALFKFDAVCGCLREEKREEFAKTMRECRKYAPDLILLNHRNDLGEAEIYATTFLWEGMETYVDVHGYNSITAPHNRAYMFFRGHTPDLKRLTEDHGVCISSSIDYFEDDLIYQAFNRSLILAPEIYGNPWLMRDDELPVLARVFNLHRRYRDILVNGMLPDPNLGLGNNAAIRGNEKRRFLATGNADWRGKIIFIPLNEKIGLAPCKKVCVSQHFPTEKFLGCFEYGETVQMVLPAFRAVLVEICDLDEADEQIVDCEYTVLHEREDGTPDTINVLYTEKNPRIFHPKKGNFTPLSLEKNIPDIRQKEPQKLGSLHTCPLPSDSERIYETACFSADNDSLEKRSLRRSGKTEIHEVQAARDAFFNQESYRLRGLDTSIPFDRDPSTLFDVKSRAYFNFDNRKGFRVEGGCLHVDFGKITDADRIEIEYFDARQNPSYMFDPQEPKDDLEISADLSNWTLLPLKAVETLGCENNRFYTYYNDKPEQTQGLRKKAIYTTEKIGMTENFRYFRLFEPIDRIYSIKFFKQENELIPENPKLTNLFAHYKKKQTKNAMQETFTLPHAQDMPAYPYLAVACEGKTGNENVMCAAEIDGKLYGFPERAPAFPSNVFEYPVHPVDGFYTFFLPIPPEWAGKEIRIYALFADNFVPTDVYLCDGHKKRLGKILTLS